MTAAHPPLSQVESTAPTVDERAARVLDEAMRLWQSSPYASNPFDQQAAALRRAGLLRGEDIAP